MEIIIDSKSGFCFGVKKVISLAEKELQETGFLYCLGDIVHNEQEIERLAGMGLKIITREEYLKLENCKVLIRAHGEPPETYDYAKKNNIKLIEGTCPVVIKLQEKVRNAFQNDQGTLLLFGKKQHPEIIGLNGQINYKAVVAESMDDLSNVDFTKPVVMLAQTTMDREKYKEFKTELENRLTSPDLLQSNDTICGQVSNRGPWLEEFSKSVDAVIFTGGKKSSNSKVLYQHCKQANPNSYFVSSVDEASQLNLSNYKSVGICGATSTPRWLMEEIARILENPSKR